MLSDAKEQLSSNILSIISLTLTNPSLRSPKSKAAFKCLYTYSRSILKHFYSRRKHSSINEIHILIFYLCFRQINISKIIGYFQENLLTSKESKTKRSDHNLPYKAQCWHCQRPQLQGAITNFTLYYCEGLCTRGETQQKAMTA